MKMFILGAVTPYFIINILIVVMALITEFKNIRKHTRPIVIIKSCVTLLLFATAIIIKEALEDAFN